MANVDCFVQGVTDITNLGGDMYHLAVFGKITDTSASGWSLDTTVSKQPTVQFRRRIRDAIVAHILASLGETVTFIVWPDLEGEVV